MENEIFNKVDELVRAGKKEEARAIIDEFLKENPNDKETGYALYEYMMTMTRVENKINEIFLSELQDIFTDLKTVNKRKKNISDKLDLAKIRAEL